MTVCRMYDGDDSGSIELEEMSAVLSNIYQCEGLSQVITTPANLLLSHQLPTRLRPCYGISESNLQAIRVSAYFHSQFLGILYRL